MKKQVTFIFIIICLWNLFSCASINYYKHFENRNALKSLPQDTKTTIYYFNNAYSQKKYIELKNSELHNMKQKMFQKYKLPFKARYTKYINYIYRCSEKRILELNTRILQFFGKFYTKYFLLEPNKVITIVLFKNFAEYSKYTKKDIPPYSKVTYGIFIPDLNSVVSYGKTGLGTLFHELMHSFIYANIKKEKYPNKWFDEGLASFYEYVAIKNNTLTDGFTNWRMPHLHKTIKNKKFKHLRKLILEYFQFQTYPYAQARFLFCYLWSKNKLVEFVKRYVYVLLPQYKGIELRRKTISLLEDLLKKNINVINKEYIALALKLKANKKLPLILK